MKENEIRPKELFERYLELSKQDATSFDAAQFQEIQCPGCGANDSNNKFDKNGFNYKLCYKCGSLYCSPRPKEKILKEFYESSQSSKYWSEIFFPAVAESRREKLFRKKTKTIYELLCSKNYGPEKICDVGAGYGVFLEELKIHLPQAKFFAIEPSPESAEKCRSKGFNTLETTAEKASEWSGYFDLVISQEVLEHVYHPLSFVESLHELTKPGGYCLVTGLGYEGYDILTLQKNSNSVFPPHHLNFLSIEGFDTLFQRAGFIDIQIWTPGELDVDIVLNSGLNNDFVQALSKRGDKAVKDFQNFLQKYKLSSHVWVFARK